MYTRIQTGFGQIRNPQPPTGEDIPTVRIVSLTFATGRELSLRGNLAVSIIVNTDRELMQEWLDLLQGLEAYQEVAGQELRRRLWRSGQGQILEPWVVKQWELALRDTGNLRQDLASRIRQRCSTHVSETQSLLADARARLQRQRAALSRVQEAVRDSEKGKKSIKLILSLRDAAEKLESVLNVLTNPLKLPEETMKRIVGTADRSADVIEQGVAPIANYSILLQLAVEGYSSVTELQQDVIGTIQQIQKLLRQLSYYRDEYDRARAIERTPIFGG